MGMGSRSRRILAIVSSALAVSVVLASCSGQSATPNSPSPIRLAKGTSFHGVTVSVPENFSVLTFNGCLLAAGQVMVGPPMASGGKCDYPEGEYSWSGTSGSSSDLPGVILSTAKYATAIAGPTWSAPTMVNGLSVEESSANTGSSCSGNEPCSLFYVRIPSKDVGIEIEAAGAPTGAAMALGRRIVATLGTEN